MDRNRGRVKFSTVPVVAIQCVLFFFGFFFFLRFCLSCQRVVVKVFFPDQRSGLGWQGCKVITALNDTLFGGYLALRSHGGLVITIALWGTETPSDLALERRHVWYSI